MPPTRLAVAVAVMYSSMGPLLTGTTRTGIEEVAQDAPVAAQTPPTETPASGHLSLRLLKRRGGWPTDALEVPLTDPLTRRLVGPRQTAALQQLARWRSQTAHAPVQQPRHTREGSSSACQVIRLSERERRAARH